MIILVNHGVATTNHTQRLAVMITLYNMLSFVFGRIQGCISNVILKFSIINNHIVWDHPNVIQCWNVVLEYVNNFPDPYALKIFSIVFFATYRFWPNVWSHFAKLNSPIVHTLRNWYKCIYELFVQKINLQCHLVRKTIIAF